MNLMHNPFTCAHAEYNNVYKWYLYIISLIWKGQNIPVLIKVNDSCIEVSNTVMINSGTDELGEVSE